MADPLSQLGVALQAALDQELTKALTLATGTANTLPDALQGAGHTLVLTGTVLPQITAGTDPSQVVVQTSAGQVSLTLDTATASLPKGAITLVVQPALPGALPAVSLLAQRPPAAAPVTQTDAAGTAQTQLALPQVQAAIPVLAAGQTITATLLPNAVTQAPPVPTQPSQVPASASPGQSQSAPVQPTATLLQIAVRPADAAPPGPDYVTLPRQAYLTVGAVPEDDAAEAVQEPGTQPANTPAPLAQPGQIALQSNAPSPASTLAAPVTPSSVSLPGQSEAVIAAPPTTPAAGPTLVQLVDESPPPSISVVAPPGTAYAAQPQTASFLVLQVTSAADAEAAQSAPTVPPGTAAPPASATSEPEAAAAQTAQSSAEPPFTATVLAQTATRQPLLASPQGGLLLSRPAAVEIGAQVTLQRVAQAPVQAAGSAAAGPGPRSADTRRRQPRE